MSASITQLVIDAARQGGEAIRAARSRPRQIFSKGFRDEVTDADFAAQEAIFATIHQHYPDHLIVSEENAIGRNLESWQPPSGYWWMIDPLDGTTNYSRGIPQYCVSVAVIEGLTVQAGAIYDPVRDHLFAAVRGEGATLNGQPIHVSARADLAEAVLQCELARDPGLRRRGLAVLHALAPRCRSVRMLGSAALAQAYVAAGWEEGHVQLRLWPWDCAAGSLLIQEAGGALALPDGGAWHLMATQIVATNRALHEVILNGVREALAAVD
jgi:myo-inositol-1(or 4)-monophosphatase